MLQNQRIIHSDDGTEKDYSIALSDFRSDSATLPIVAADDYLIIAADYPFNHRYFLIDTPNDQASGVSVQIWWGNAWYDAVDVVDQTDDAGVTFAQSGIIEWKTDRLKGWDIELDSDDVTDVSAVGIYNMYWLRLVFSGDLKASTAVKYVGHRFSDDTTLYTYYPDLDNTKILLAFAATKTTWDTQHFMAAETIIEDLRQRNIALSPNQILDYRMFERASVHKCAELIYHGMGRAYNDNRKAAAEYYKAEMNKAFFNIDRNKNALLEPREKEISVRYMSR